MLHTRTFKHSKLMRNWDAFRFLIMKVLLGAFNKEKALLVAFNGHCETFAKVTSLDQRRMSPVVLSYPDSYCWAQIRPIIVKDALIVSSKKS